MLATPASALPSGPAWTYEVKWDSYRTLALKDGPRVRLLSRHLKDLTRQYPPIAQAVSSLAAVRAPRHRDQPFHAIVITRCTAS
jgi:bifunctional non-homologous end joining protein LigD